MRVPGPIARCRPVALVELADAPVLDETATRAVEPVAERRPSTNPTGAPGAAPLEGLRVLDLTTSFAGPLVGRTLAAFGARVVKVESEKRPDYARSTGPFLQRDNDGSASYAHTNAQKWSIALDLSNPAARPVLRDLARWADVIIDAYAPGALSRMGLGPEVLAELNPSVVLLQTTMLGQDGPFADMPGYGNMAGALCGFFTTTAWRDRAPVGPCGAYTDMISPRFSLATLLAALDHRRRTGEGTRIDLGQGESCLQMLAIALADSQASGRSWEHQGNRDPFRAPHGVYPAAGDDRWLAVACNDDLQWGRLTSVLGRDDLTALTLEDRRARHDELDAIISTWSSANDADASASMLQGAGVPAHAVQNSPQCAEDPQLLHRGWLTTVPHTLLGEIPVGTPSIRLSRTPAMINTAGPMLGEHTLSVLTELLGYDDDQVTELVVADILR